MIAREQIGLRIGLSLVALVGLAGGSVLSLAERATPGTCPALGPLPACYLVMAGYALVLVSAWIGPQRLALRLGGAGLAPVLLLALVGSVSELFIGEVCPRHGSAIPQCYLSLGLALLAFGLGLLLLRRGDRDTSARARISHPKL